MIIQAGNILAKQTKKIAYPTQSVTDCTLQSMQFHTTVTLQMHLPKAMQKKLLLLFSGVTMQRKEPETYKDFPGSMP